MIEPAAGCRLGVSDSAAPGAGGAILGVAGAEPPDFRNLALGAVVAVDKVLQLSRQRKTTASESEKSKAEPALQAIT